MKRILIAIFLILVAAVAASAWWGYAYLRKPVSHSKSGQYVEIPKGSS